MKAYKAHLRDFLIEVLVSVVLLVACGMCVLHESRVLQQFKAEDSDAPGDDLFAEERTAAAAAAAQQELDRRRAVPGLMNPYAGGMQLGDMDDL